MSSYSIAGDQGHQPHSQKISIWRTPDGSQGPVYDYTDQLPATLVKSDNTGDNKEDDKDPKEMNATELLYFVCRKLRDKYNLTAEQKRLSMYYIGEAISREEQIMKLDAFLHLYIGAFLSETTYHDIINGLERSLNYPSNPEVIRDAFSKYIQSPLPSPQEAKATTVNAYVNFLRTNQDVIEAAMFNTKVHNKTFLWADQLKPLNWWDLRIDLFFASVDAKSESSISSRFLPGRAPSKSEYLDSWEYHKLSRIAGRKALTPSERILWETISRNGNTVPSDLSDIQKAEAYALLLWQKINGYDSMCSLTEGPAASIESLQSRAISDALLALRNHISISVTPEQEAYILEHDNCPVCLKSCIPWTLVDILLATHRDWITAFAPDLDLPEGVISDQFALQLADEVRRLNCRADKVTHLDIYDCSQCWVLASVLNKFDQLLKESQVGAELPRNANLVVIKWLKTLASSPEGLFVQLINLSDVQNHAGDARDKELCTQCLTHLVHQSGDAKANARSYDRNVVNHVDGSVVHVFETLAVPIAKSLDTPTGECAASDHLLSSVCSKLDSEERAALQIPWTWFDKLLGPYGIAPGSLVYYIGQPEGELAPHIGDTISVGHLISYDHYHPHVYPGLDALGLGKKVPSHMIVKPLFPFLGSDTVESVPVWCVFPLGLVDRHGRVVKQQEIISQVPALGNKSLAQTLPSKNSIDHIHNIKRVLRYLLTEANEEPADAISLSPKSLGCGEEAMPATEKLKHALLALRMLIEKNLALQEPTCFRSITCWLTSSLRTHITHSDWHLATPKGQGSAPQVIMLSGSGYMNVKNLLPFHDLFVRERLRNTVDLSIDLLDQCVQRIVNWAAPKGSPSYIPLEDIPSGAGCSDANPTIDDQFVRRRLIIDQAEIAHIRRQLGSQVWPRWEIPREEGTQRLVLPAHMTLDMIILIISDCWLNNPEYSAQMTFEQFVKVACGAMTGYSIRLDRIPGTPDPMYYNYIISMWKTYFEPFLNDDRVTFDLAELQTQRTIPFIWRDLGNKPYKSFSLVVNPNGPPDNDYMALYAAVVDRLQDIFWAEDYGVRVESGHGHARGVINRGKECNANRMGDTHCQGPDFLVELEHCTNNLTDEFLEQAIEETPVGDAIVDTCHDAIENSTQLYHSDEDKAHKYKFSEIELHEGEENDEDADLLQTHDIIIE